MFIVKLLGVMALCQYLGMSKAIWVVAFVFYELAVLGSRLEENGR